MDSLFGGGKLSQNSQKLYFGCLTKLLGKDFKNINGLKKTDDIIKKIEEKKSHNTRRTYYLACLYVMKDKPAFKKQYDTFHEKMMSINKDFKPSDEKTEKQKENWMSFNELKELRDKMEEEVTPMLKKKISEEVYNKLLDLVILSLYTLQSPRRSQDYTQMVIGKGDDPAMNYLDGSHFKFNNYKTKTTYNTQVVPISPDMMRVLKLYLKYHSKTDPHLLMTMDGKHIDKSTQMTYMLNRIIGKKISVSMIRNIFATDNSQEDKQELKKAVDTLKDTAQEMGTSVNMLINNYTKTD